jgi:hypothetical protein
MSAFAVAAVVVVVVVVVLLRVVPFVNVFARPFFDWLAPIFPSVFFFARFSCSPFSILLVFFSFDVGLIAIFSALWVSSVLLYSSGGNNVTSSPNSINSWCFVDLADGGALGDFVVGSICNWPARKSSLKS